MIFDHLISGQAPECRNIRRYSYELFFYFLDALGHQLGFWQIHVEKLYARTMSHLTTNVEGQLGMHRTGWFSEFVCSEDPPFHVGLNFSWRTIFMPFK